MEGYSNVHALKKIKEQHNYIHFTFHDRKGKKKGIRLLITKTF